MLESISLPMNDLQYMCFEMSLNIQLEVILQIKEDIGRKIFVLASGNTLFSILVCKRSKVLLKLLYKIYLLLKVHNL
jgi:hypothetical protein